jgi:hypothetical protein
MWTADDEQQPFSLSMAKLSTMTLSLVANETAAILQKA